MKIEIVALAFCKFAFNRSEINTDSYVNYRMVLEGRNVIACCLVVDLRVAVYLFERHFIDCLIVRPVALNSRWCPQLKHSITLWESDGHAHISLCESDGHAHITLWEAMATPT